MKKQKGFIPVAIVVALAISAIVGGVVGFQLGDGTFFSFGVGFGIVLVISFIFKSQISIFTKIIERKKGNES